MIIFKIMVAMVFIIIIVHMIIFKIMMIIIIFHIILFKMMMIMSIIPRAARIPADQKTSPQRAGRKRRPPIREPYWSWYHYNYTIMITKNPNYHIHNHHHTTDLKWIQHGDVALGPHLVCKKYSTWVIFFLISTFIRKKLKYKIFNLNEKRIKLKIFHLNEQHKNYSTWMRKK